MSVAARKLFESRLTSIFISNRRVQDNINEHEPTLPENLIEELPLFAESHPLPVQATIHPDSGLKTQMLKIKIDNGPTKGLFEINPELLVKNIRSSMSGSRTALINSLTTEAPLHQKLLIGNASSPESSHSQINRPNMRRDSPKKTPVKSKSGVLIEDPNTARITPKKKEVDHIFQTKSHLKLQTVPMKLPAELDRIFATKRPAQPQNMKVKPSINVSSIVSLHPANPPDASPKSTASFTLDCEKENK